MMQNNDENRNIGENIRLYRIRAGLTVKELSKRIRQHHDLEIKPGSIRNYEKGTEKIPAVALNSIAAITRTNIRKFYEPAHPTVLLNTSHKSTCSKPSA
jgi:transcriptional regulator with XRE-family HTH domain